MRTKPTLSVCIAHGALAVALAGCGGAQRHVTIAPQTTEVAADVDAFSDLLVTSLDAYPRASPKAMAEEADLVLRGVVRDVREGRVQQVDPEHDLHFQVLTVEPTALLKGELAEHSDGRVYIEVPAQDGTAAEGARSALPSGVEVQAYLRPAPVQGSFIDPTAGRPDGQTLWTAFLSGGLVLQHDDRLQVPYGRGWDGQELSFDDFGPDRASWPPLRDPATGQPTE